MRRLMKNGARLLRRHFPYILFVNIVVTAAIYFSPFIIPVVGVFLILPIRVGFAQALYSLVKSGRRPVGIPLLLGFEDRRYLYNLLSLALRRILITIGYAFFILPGMVMSAAFAMVPYLLADDKFDQRRHNPLIASITIMRGEIRNLFFVHLWFYIGVGSWLAFTAYYLISEGIPAQWRDIGAIDIPRIAFWVILLSPLIKYLILDPYYHSIHAVLYKERKRRLPKRYRQ